MIRHNAVEVANPQAMWEEHDGTRAYVVHGRQPSLFFRGLEVIDFSGAGVLAKSYVRNLDDAQKALAGFSSQEAVIEAVRQSRGSIALHLFDHETRDYLILNDPLGGGQIYLRETDGRALMASDLNTLSDVCSFRKSPLRKNPVYFLTQALTYTQTHGADTPYQDVILLHRGESLRVSKAGKIERFLIVPPEQFYFSDLSYQDGIDELVKDMLENVSLAAEHRFDLKISHLTAGFDSRLVLAAMLKAGVADQFIYYCISTSPDLELSRKLTGHLGLRHTSDNDGNPRGRGYQRDFHEFVRNAPRASQLTIGEGLDFRYAPRNNLVFQGGYGELARTFNSLKWDGDTSDTYSLAYGLWRWNGFPKESDLVHSIWSRDYLDIVLERLEADIVRFKGTGLVSDFFTNWFYIERRNRLFIGARTYYANQYRSQMDPIYSSHLAWLPAKLEFYERKSNFIGLDAMNAMFPLLASLPFDNEKIGSLYRKNRKLPGPETFNGRDPVQVKLAHTIPEPTPWPGEPANISAEASEIAKKLRIPEIVVHGIETLSPSALQRVESDPILCQMMNVKNLDFMRTPLADITRDRAELLRKLLTALVLSEII